MRAIIACSASIRSVHLSSINKQKMSVDNIALAYIMQSYCNKTAYMYVRYVFNHNRYFARELSFGILLVYSSLSINISK